ncbi:MAG: UDP-glucose 4-epimerase GalE [Oscillospiraceae bacterium]|jgi:UDP-glucose 4-epimerase|nr:UDP-glucose 4-epimerase GalE [Oscillospiraceae bacterium]
MTILVTGGAGYVGSHVAAELLAAGYSVIIADNYSNSSRDVPSAVARAAGSDVIGIEVDLTNQNALNDVFKNRQIDAVIHCAGSKAVGESVEKPVMYYRNNIAGTLNLLDAMKSNGTGRLIFSSSATVYGTPRSLPLTEDMAAWPCTNPYGTTKLVIEKLIEDAAAAYPLSAVLLRYFNPAGAHRSGLLGESPSGIPNNLMPYITGVAVGKLERLTVYGGDWPTRDGTGVRDYIHVTDLALGHLAALEYCFGHTGVESFNLGRGCGCSVLELISAFERVNGVKIPYTVARRRDGDVAESYAGVEKAARELGWSARLSIDDMCRDTWKYITARGS